MCGCMLMHAMMDHEEHPHSTQSASAMNAIPAASAKKCSHCGSALEQGFSFCPNCGMSLKTLKCEACGQKVDPTWNACAYCGSPLSKPETQTV